MFELHYFTKIRYQNRNHIRKYLKFFAAKGIYIFFLLRFVDKYQKEEHNTYRWLTVREGT